MFFIIHFTLFYSLQNYLCTSFMPRCPDVLPLIREAGLNYAGKICAYGTQ